MANPLKNLTTENTKYSTKNTEEQRRINIEQTNYLTQKIIGVAMKVHTELGPGLLESAYKECLDYELVNAGLYIQKEFPVPLIYKEIKLDCGYRADIVVNNEVIVEIKAVEALNDVHLAQVLTYLKVANKKIGLLMNFNVARLKDGIRRVIL